MARVSIHAAGRDPRLPVARNGRAGAGQAAGAAAHAVVGPGHRVRPSRAPGGADARPGGHRGEDPRSALRAHDPWTPVPPSGRHRAGGCGRIRSDAAGPGPRRGEAGRTHGDDPRAGRTGGPGRRRPGPHRPLPAGGERRPRRVAGRHHRALRPGFSRSAGRGARRHHAGAPALLPGRRSRRRVDAALHRGEQHREPQPRHRARRQRAGHPAPAERCRLLLPHRSRAPPAFEARGARGRRLPAQARLVAREVRAGGGARRPGGAGDGRVR